MNILMILTNNPLHASGGVVLDLFNGFKNKGHNVKLLVNTYDPNYPQGIISMKTFFSFWKENLLRRITNKLKLNKNTITDPRYHFHDLHEKKEYYKTNKLIKKAKIEPDAIIIFFAKNFVNSKNIFELYKKKILRYTG